MTTVSYQPTVRPARRGGPITWRMVVIAAVPLLIIGAMLYTFLQPDIKDLGNGFKEVDLKAMSNFPFPQVNGTLADVPEKFRQLDGQKVVLSGELYSLKSAGNSSESDIQICYSRAKCCFAGPPQVQHFVNLKPAPGTKLSYYDNLVHVTGVLHIDVQKDEASKNVTQVYRMDVTNIDPA